MVCLTSVYCRKRMLAAWKRICFIFIVSGVFGLQVHVRVDEDDDGQIDDCDEEYRQYNSLDPEDPPFQVPEVSPVPKVIHHSVSVDEHLREKRDETELKEFKNMPMSDCLAWYGKVSYYTDRRPLQISRVLAINESIEIPCYHCGDFDNLKPPIAHTNLLYWRYLGRNRIDGYWRMRPVLDYRKDNLDFQSRVNVTSNFTLSIRNVQEQDTGMYYCERLMRNSDLREQKFNDQQLNDFLSRERHPKHLKLFFHIDVKLPNDIPEMQVSETDPAYPRPAPRVENKTLNLVFTTYWGEWSTCSVCGEEGERWRKGVCWATIIDRTKPIEPAYIYYILAFAEKGVPCSSSLLKKYPKMTNPARPDEKMFESCNVTCVNNTRTDKMTSNIKKVKFHSLLNGHYINITVMEGESATLVCPGVSLDTVVYWVNGSKYLTSVQLRNITNHRAEIDVYSVLRFHSTVVADTGFYSCWHTKKRQIVYALTVIPFDNSGEWLYYMRYVCLSFIFDTVIFIALMAVKAKHRHVNQPRRSQKVDDNDESGDENRNNFYDDSSSEDEWDNYNEGHFD